MLNVDSILPMSSSRPSTDVAGDGERFLDENQNDRHGFCDVFDTLEDQTRPDTRPRPEHPEPFMEGAENKDVEIEKGVEPKEDSSLSEVSLDSDLGLGQNDIAADIDDAFEIPAKFDAKAPVIGAQDGRAQQEPQLEGSKQKASVEYPSVKLPFAAETALVLGMKQATATADTFAAPTLHANQAAHNGSMAVHLASAATVANSTLGKEHNAPASMVSDDMFEAQNRNPTALVQSNGQAAPIVMKNTLQTDLRVYQTPDEAVLHDSQRATPKATPTVPSPQAVIVHPAQQPNALSTFVLPTIPQDRPNVLRTSEEGNRTGIDALGELRFEYRTAGTQPVVQALAKPEMSQTILRQMTYALRTQINAENTVEIALRPAELGRVRIYMSTAEAGMVVTITAERAETLELMRRNIDELARSFMDMGHDNPAFNFEQGSAFSHEDDASKPNSETGDDQPKNLHISSDKTQPLAILQTQTSGVDILL